MNKRNTLLGLAWVILGIAGTLDTGIRAWRSLSTLPGVNLRVLFNYLNPVIITLVILAVGIGIMADKKWGRIVAVVLSPLLLAYDLFMIGSLPFLYPKLEGIEAGPALRGFVVGVLIIIPTLSTLVLFFRGRMRWVNQS